VLLRLWKAAHALPPQIEKSLGSAAMASLAGNGRYSPEAVVGTREIIRTPCITLREERRIEEAPAAYKPIGPVIAAREEAGLIEAVARLRPLLTFKA